MDQASENEEKRFPEKIKGVCDKHVWPDSAEFTHSSQSPVSRFGCPGESG